jgi:ABC-type Mn2+/Zn2+ transport system ATPase subunit
MLTAIKSFRAENILGGTTYELNIDSDATIIVGPNGTGKSTFLSLFYLFITRQWTRLEEYDFQQLTLTLANDTITLSKTDLIGAESLSKLPIRFRSAASSLNNTQNLMRFLSPENLSPKERKQFSEKLRIPERDFEMLRKVISREMRDVISTSFLEAERKLDDLRLPKVLYLPTYRRIEKDLKSIFPDVEERFRSRTSEQTSFSRSGPSFVEIVSFGMEDIGKMTAEFTAKLNAVSKNKSNAAAQEYIRDMVQGRIGGYSIGPIREISQTTITEFVDRMDDNLLSIEDKEKLKKEIDKIRKRQAGKPSKDMQYLAFFVEKMLEVYVELQKEEAPLVQFTKIVQKYFHNKAIEYKNYNIKISDLNGNDVAISDLSSGEKQILSTFAYLLLSPDPNYIVFIDEPELSLSVPWQKTFLPDIIDTARCTYLLAVSHSPFVFDNELREQIIDVRKLNASRGEHSKK